MQDRKRILCVEDYLDMCVLITTVLSPHQVIGVHNKADAIKKVAVERFDLYLLDYHLPDGTDLELCRYIRSIDTSTPIYFCTGTSSLTDNQAKRWERKDS